MISNQKFRRDFEGAPERLEKMKEFIQNYWIENHRSPNVREVRMALGGLSTSVISYYRDRLEHDGWLEVTPKPRAVCSFVPTEIFADRPVFPILAQAIQDELDSLSEKLAMNNADMTGGITSKRLGVWGGDRIFDKKIQVGPEMIPAVTDADLNHMSTIHREKE